MRIEARAANAVTTNRLQLTCPNCKKFVLTEALVPDNLIISPQGGHYVGIRRCPDSTCYQLIVLIADEERQVLHTYPLVRKDFNPSDIPPKIVSHMEEALTCRANNCYIAAAIMLRKTLESLCEEVGATGSNLRARVTELQTKVILPPELLSGLDDIRLLGNDAAHVESQTFADISPNELDVSIEIINEVLKGVFQYRSLLDRIQSLKR